MSTNAKTTTPTILIIDDDQLLLDMYATKFREEGMDVKTADGADAALRLLRDGTSVDAILLDVVMPNMDGFTFIETLDAEELRGKTKLIVLSNQSGEADRTRADEVGVDGYIVKANAIPSEVVEQVRAIIEK